MFACLILGDSTAVGSAAAINARYGHHCDVQARERAHAAEILRWARPAKAYATCLYGLGSNDAPDASLVERLVAVRTQFCRQRVIWLLPYGRAQASVVRSVAVRFGDETLDLALFPSRDRVHPARYRDVAAALLR